MKENNALTVRNVTTKQKKNEMAIFTRNRDMQINNHEG